MRTIRSKLWLAVGLLAPAAAFAQGGGTTTGVTITGPGSGAVAYAGNGSYGVSVSGNGFTSNSYFSGGITTGQYGGNSFGGGGGSFTSTINGHIYSWSGSWGSQY